MNKKPVNFSFMRMRIFGETQELIAARFGISERTWRNYESGNSKPSDEKYIHMVNEMLKQNISNQYLIKQIHDETFGGEND